MQVSHGASLLNPGAKFNKPLDSWSFCFKIWGQRLWPVNHQLSALPSKIKIKKKQWQLLGLKHPCIPAAAAWFSIPEVKWEKPCTAEEQLCQHTGKVHLYLELSPKSVSVFLLHSNAPAAVTGITRDTYLFKINSQSTQLGTQLPVPTKTNHKHKPHLTQNPRAPQENWSWETVILNQISWGDSVALLVQLSRDLHSASPKHTKKRHKKTIILFKHTSLKTQNWNSHTKTSHRPKGLTWKCLKREKVIGWPKWLNQELKPHSACGYLCCASFFKPMCENNLS